MKNEKSPGTDGFTAEFTNFLGWILGNEVLKSLNEAFYTGELSTTQKQGIITLLPKNNKPREFIQNWRPITLLNVEYKLLAGVLAAQIKKVLPKIIADDQKGFIKDRYIGENIRTIVDSIEYAKNKKTDGCVTVHRL